MAEMDNAAKARLGKYKKQADKLGLNYHEDITEEDLKDLLASVKEAQEEASGNDAMKVLAKTIGEEVGTALRKAQGTESTRRVSYDQMDKSDEVEPKTYFANGSFYKLPPLLVGGQEVDPPYGPIKFEFHDGESVMNGDQANTKYICSYTSKSRKEQAHIESHDAFKKRVHLAASEALNGSTNSSKYALYSTHMANLGGVQSRELYERASALNIPVSPSMSIPRLREAIATELTDRDMERQANRFVGSDQVGREQLLSPTP